MKTTKDKKPFAPTSGSALTRVARRKPARSGATRSSERTRCPSCDGHRYIVFMFPAYTTNVPCQDCEGSGFARNGKVSDER